MLGMTHKMTSFGYNTLGFGSFTSRGYNIQSLVIAGGAGGGGRNGGGGGAGGYLSSIEGESTGGGGTLQDAFLASSVWFKGRYLKCSLVES